MLPPRRGDSNFKGANLINIRCDLMGYCGKKRRGVRFLLFGIFRSPYVFEPPLRILLFEILVPPTFFKPPFGFCVSKIKSEFFKTNLNFVFFVCKTEKRQIEANFKNSKWDLKLSLRSLVYLPRSNRILTKFRFLESWDSELSNDLNFIEIRHDLFGLVTVSK